MEYVYSAMLLHSAKKEINEAHVTKVLEAAGITVDSARVKALVASLKNVNIDDAIAKAAVSAAPAAAPAAHAEHKAEAKPKQEEKKSEEEAAAGLAGLFG
ncbi:MAG: 50S ribosomal protein P1 [Candidatus Diapherotrites archaeon]|uniref:Large ribosomal subunit protein P1 n=1 Tax=Candidatus Iainarchaeum sp. TaxID=3101447 RepID=A0A8T4CAX8_9ARCH|nr:50S ribosomal protein P1 [Candidatus Diapherotrites archaeon]